MTKNKKPSQQPSRDRSQSRDHVNYSETPLRKNEQISENNRFFNLEVSPAQPITQNVKPPKPKK